MRILLLSPWFPSPPFGGALIRVHETLRHLSRHHRVTLIAPLAGDPERVAPLRKMCETVVAVPVSETAGAVVGRLATGLVRGMPLIQGLHCDREMAREVRRLTSRDAFDVIHVEHSFMAPYLDHVSRDSRAKTVLSMHNVESLRFRRELQTAGWSTRRLALLTDHVLFGSWEEKAIRRFDGIVAVSGFEETWIRTHAPGAAVTVVPNGVNIDHFSPAPSPHSSRTIVFPGLMNYPPNVDAVVWFCDAVLPRVLDRHPDVRFVIVGDKPTPQVVALGLRPHVEVTGRVADVRPYLAACAAVVVPLRSGAGTRLKILEALSMKRPVVSTRQGAEGLDITHGTHALIGDSPNEIADHLCAVIKKPDLAARLATAGRHLVETQYDWKSCFRGLDDLYHVVTARSRPRARRDVERFAS